ncbi:methylated-DNA--[protein]-cysteine S-methyltransferase [Oceanobacillus luteolus]|uniref:Methylated-DNA--protein-cysteine methyltransferase n=1 Tax=Oceanobacillus luteolus TaxID=1274358 RepID=A0ABW4HP40_9BACI|nr:methylated-DNA--[protein]-cysteine S-methyltransferase [Oceanobacillus luteolus]MCM3740378.1 methylated-DNA--[protein]-cysteine S-methyltransferase [Oceanobacillus luteolus]
MGNGRIVYYDSFERDDKRMILAATEKGLCWAGGFNEDEQQMQSWLLKQEPHRTFQKDEQKLRIYIEAMERYFSGDLRTFDIPLDLRGTPFQLAVWKVLQHIPYGETRTYSDIANDIGNPQSVRAVGTAIGRNPVLIAIPCHRVIQKNGALGGFRAGLSLKEFLLQLESEKSQTKIPL